MNFSKLSPALHGLVGDLSPMGHGELAMTGAADVAMVSVTEVLDFDDLRWLSRPHPESLAGCRGVRACTAVVDDSRIEEEAGELMVEVFLRSAPDLDLNDLEKLGLVVDSLQDSLRPASVPVRALPQLSDDPRIEEVIAAVRVRPTLEDAHRQTRLTSAALAGGGGEGVIIGIVDTGIDCGHPAFAGRILRLWDQTIPGSGPAMGSELEFRTGREYESPRTNLNNDEVGHGTHVAGIAAGEDANHPGVAPKAKLVVVKANYETASLASAVRYVFAVAKEEGLPAVVNLSWGGHDDPHDGADPLSEVIDRAVGPGRIVCAAAGNEGDNALHAWVEVAAGAEEGVGFEVRESSVEPEGITSSSAESVWMNVWYIGGPLEVAVTSPAGETTPWQPVLTDMAAVQVVLRGGVVEITSPKRSSHVRAPEGHNVLVRVDPPGDESPVVPGRWQVRLRARESSGCVHLWLYGEDAEHDVVAFVDHEVNGFKVGSPGAASGAITVGASVSRVWPPSGGRSPGPPEVLGEIASFSSPGPRRDGKPKPDVVAPGTMIVSARARGLPADQEYDIDDWHVANEGTSMSTPYVTGLVALMLAANSQLDPTQVRARLAAASEIPPGASNRSPDVWGGGLVDASRLIDAPSL